MGRLIKDTLIAVFADEHTASAVAPFPPGQWEMRGANVSATTLQAKLYEHYREFCIRVGERRQGKRLVVVKNGDLIDGVHHDTKELATQYLNEQASVQSWMTDLALQDMGFDKEAGDLLYFVAGTPAHAGETEERIAKDFYDQIQPYTITRCVWPVLHLDINGRYCFFAHHGPTGGRGRNKGNSLRARLKAIWDDYRDAGKRTPDLVVFADKHKRTQESLFVDGLLAMHGVICPPWQAKTDFVYRIAPDELTNVGGTIIEIGVDGTIRPPEFVLMDVELDPVQYV